MLSFWLAGKQWHCPWTVLSDMLLFLPYCRWSSFKLCERIFQQIRRPTTEVWWEARRKHWRNPGISVSFLVVDETRFKWFYIMTNNRNIRRVFTKMGVSSLTSISQPIIHLARANFYGPPDGSQRAIMFLPCPSVRPWGSTIFLLSKNTFYGVLRRFGMFLTFSIFVRACVRYALCTKFCGLNLS